MTEKQLKEYEFLKKENKGIITNKHNFDGFSIRENTKTNIFWPCIMYYIEVKVDNTELDIFEKTVLKLADCNITKSEMLAELLNMEVETVKFIQDRVGNKGYLTPKTYTIADKGGDYLKRIAKGETLDIEVICLFRDLITGNFLDMVEMTPVKNTLTIKRKNDYVQGVFTLPGDNEKKGYVVISSNYERFWNDEPETHTILRTIRRYNTLDNKKINLSNYSNAINVMSKEVMFVHTVGFATRNADIYSTDANGIGVSDLYSDFLRNSKDYSWIENILTKGKQQKNKIDELPFSKEELKFTFPKISRLLFDAETYFKKTDLKSADKKITKETIKHFCEKAYYSIYTAFEYALQLYYKDFHDYDQEDAQIQLANKGIRENKQSKIKELYIEDNILLFSKLAEDNGFELPSDSLTALKVYPGKIREMRNSKEPELIPLLCLCLAYSTHDCTTPLNELSNHHKEFISDILDLKNLRDKTSLAHGEEVDASMISKEKCRSILDKVTLYISFLLPQLNDDITLIKNHFKMFTITTQSCSTTQQRYEIKLELYKNFGYVAINNLPSNIVKPLIDYYIAKLDKRFITATACSLLQKFFDYCISKRLKFSSPPERSNRNSKYAQIKCNKTHFNLADKTLPTSIKTVNYKRIDKSVTGGGSDTLGAAIIGFILMISNNELEDIAKTYPDFIIGLDKLLTMRGHSDIHEYSEKEVSTVDEITTSIVKILLNHID